MNIKWQYADQWGLLSEPDAMKVEAMVQIAEQLAELNENIKNLKSVKVSVAR